jgi:ribosomal protein S8
MVGIPLQVLLDHRRTYDQLRQIKSMRQHGVGTHDIYTPYSVWTLQSAVSEIVYGVIFCVSWIALGA